MATDTGEVRGREPDPAGRPYGHREESRAQEITANLRPKPDFTAATDYIHPFRSYGALDDAQPSISLSYLF